MAASRGRHDSRARSVQSPRPTGTQVRRRPSGATGMPVDSITFSSATRDSCSTWIRWMGSTLGCDTPPVATLRAKERVISHWSGALVPSMFIRSPSSDWNGFPESPGSGGAITSCYDDEASSGTSASAVPRTAVATTVLPFRSRVSRELGARRVRIEAGPQLGIGADRVPVDGDDDVPRLEAGFVRGAPGPHRSDHRAAGRCARRASSSASPATRSRTPTVPGDPEPALDDRTAGHQLSGHVLDELPGEEDRGAWRPAGPESSKRIPHTWPGLVDERAAEVVPGERGGHRGGGELGEQRRSRRAGRRRAPCRRRGGCRVLRSL